MAIRESEGQSTGDFSSVFSMAVSRSFPNPLQCQSLSLTSNRWPSLPDRTSLWTKYCVLCTICGSAATILAGIFLIVAALLRYHTTSIYYFETVPTYLPSILLSICGVSTIAFSCKRNRNIILLRITACWSLVSAALSSVITITTSLIHMNRLQTLKECVYSRNPPSCTCFGHFAGVEGVTAGLEPHHFVFENTSDCDVIHGVLYSCLRAIFAISVVAVLLSIFLCMLLHQLIGHERKKAYWTRIRRINSDWSSDFLNCLARPIGSERSILPLIASSSTSTSLGFPLSCSMIASAATAQWGPPPPYQSTENSNRQGLEIQRSSVRSTEITLVLNSSSPNLPLANVPSNVETIEISTISNNSSQFPNTSSFSLQRLHQSEQTTGEVNTQLMSGEDEKNYEVKSHISLPVSPVQRNRLVRRRASCSGISRSGKRRDLPTQSLPTTPRKICPFSQQ